MFARLATRIPIRTAPRATARYNSSSSSSRAARVIEMAAQAERPSTFSLVPCTRIQASKCSKGSVTNQISLDVAETAVPALWALTGVLTFTVWNRMTERSAGENVEKMLIV
jgi:hypothetical protein